MFLVVVVNVDGVLKRELNQHWGFLALDDGDVDVGGFLVRCLVMDA